MTVHFTVFNINVFNRKFDFESLNWLSKSVTLWFKSVGINWLSRGGWQNLDTALVISKILVLMECSFLCNLDNRGEYYENYEHFKWNQYIQPKSRSVWSILFSQHRLMKTFVSLNGIIFQEYKMVMAWFKPEKR